MATRTHRFLQNACIRTFKVETSGDVTLGRPVKFGNADDEVENASTNEKSIGTAYLSETTDGARVQVVMHGHSIVPVLVGTGGATRGEYAIATTDGYTNQTLGGGTTVKYIAGQFLQSGVAGDYVGMQIGGGYASGAA